MFQNLRIMTKFTRQMSSDKYRIWTTPKNERFSRIRKSWKDKVTNKQNKKNIKNRSIKKKIIYF